MVLLYTMDFMNVAIVGGGFTGLTAAYHLAKHGHTVTVFERDDHLGGLAYGFTPPAGGWDWHLEAAYHHLFTNDDAVIGLAKKLNVSLITKRPITANLYKGKTYQFDSPLHLLQFPYLTLSDKLRTGVLAAFCKLYPFWQTLEGITAKQFAVTVGGQAGWHTIWEPLMTAKFGNFADTVAASWLWARIHKRTPSLVYIEGGFQTLVNALAGAINKQGGNIITSHEFKKISSDFDKTLLTVPTTIAEKIIGTKLSENIPHLHAQVLILETKEPILKDVYWLNITDRTYPFLAVVQHTNFMDKSHYGGNHLTYIGNYLPTDHPYLKLNKDQLLKKFLPFIKRLSPTMNYELITNNFLFVAPFAQPVHQLYYSRKAPKLETPIPNVYLANMDSIYPWDRGTNYAVGLGLRAAKLIHEKR